MRIDEFDYDLPPELIAQTPVEPRDYSRLLVVHRDTGELEHRHFYDLPEYLAAGDLLVANESKVLPARLLGEKVGTGGRVEVLLLRPVVQPEEQGAEPRVWEGLVSPGRRIHDGTLLGFGSAEGGAYLQAEVVARTELGGRILRFDKPPRPLLDELGQMPLPPYIHEKLDDPGRYQTVYARIDGSAAAPTAGLHFTERLLGELREKGVEWEPVTLHVGLDTFRPIHEERVEDHPMHKEWYDLPERTAEALTATRSAGNKVVAVGTTSVRVLETVAGAQSLRLDEREQGVKASEGWTQLYLTPGSRFGLVDVMLTNFHLPRTTLLLLISAFAGKDLVMKAYAEAVKERYRFFSFGDAMLIL
jgi:S-adenosylmethionine:tRNA ribosyltransferase-isomerase